jgi:drug/metabolite transporter (DMT)-like permease
MVAMKGTIPHTTPFFLATIRLLPAGILVLLVGLWQGRAQPQGWVAWGWLLAFTVVDGTLFQGFLAQGLMRTGAGLGSVMIDSQPLVVALLALWLFQERIGNWGWLGLGLGIIGISLLGLPEPWLQAGFRAFGTLFASGAIDLGNLGNNFTVWELGHNWEGASSLFTALFDNGQWLMLMAALSMAVGTILSRFVSGHADPIVATGWHMVLGSLPLAWFSWQQEVAQWNQLTLGDYGALAYSTVFGTAIAYGLFFYFAAQGSLTSLSALTFLTPVFALLFGNLLLHEALSPIHWSGVGLTLVSIYLINQRQMLSQGWKPGNNQDLNQREDGPEV